MKGFLVLISMVLPICVFCQLDVKKIWVGDDLAYIRFDSSEVFFEIPGVPPVQKKYRIVGDTLRMYDRYTHSRDNYKNIHIDNYDFLINEYSDTSLILAPIGKNALIIAENKRQLRYKERHLVSHPVKDFEYIKFKTTRCLGTCPAQTYQIFSNRIIQYTGGAYAVKKGFYTGIVSDTLFDELIHEIALANIDKLTTWAQQVEDAPEITIEVKYGDKVKYFKYFISPGVAESLESFLTKIPSMVELTESKERFIIDFSE